MALLAILLLAFQTSLATDDDYYSQNIDFLNNLYSNYYYYDQYYTDTTAEQSSNSISDYTLYFNDYTFNSDSPQDWEQNYAKHGCSFTLKSIEKRICLSNDNQHRITLKSSNPSAKAIDLDWDNNAHWNSITHSLAHMSDMPTQAYNAINTKTINDILRFKANSAHSALANYYGSMPDFSTEPFTSEMAETLTQSNDEMYGFPNSQSNVAQQSMQQMQGGMYGRPGMNGQMNNWGQNMFGLGSQIHPGMGQYSHGYGHSIRPTIPGQQMLTQQLLRNPQIQRHIQSNPDIMKYLTAPTGHGSNNALLEALLKQDIADKAHPQLQKHGNNNGLLSMIMADETKKNLANMFGEQSANNKRFMQHSKSEFENLANGIRRADHKLDVLMAKSGHKGKGMDMAALIHALGQGKGDETVTVPKEKMGSSYKKQFDDYMQKYQKYYKDWYRSFGGQNMGGMPGMGMGMGGMPGMGMGMGMPMGGYGMGMGMPITHVHIHHSNAGAHTMNGDILGGESALMTEKCAVMKDFEICAKKANDYGNNMELTVRIGSKKKLRKRDGFGAYQVLGDLMREKEIESAKDELSDLYAYYGSDSDSDLDTFNGRRLIENEFENENEYEMSDFGDMFGYTFWRAEMMDWDSFSAESDSDSESVYGLWNGFGDYQYIMNGIHYELESDNNKNEKCSAIVPGLFARVCMRVSAKDGNVRLHLDSANVNEINDLLNYDGERAKSESVIKGIHAMLNKNEKTSLDWNRDSDWSEIRTVYENAQKYYENNKRTRRRLADLSGVSLEKCKHLFTASICVKSNAERSRFALNINVLSAKVLLEQYETENDFSPANARQITNENIINDYYSNLYDNVYHRVKAQQLKAAQIGRK